MSIWLAADPPAPQGVSSETWADALRAERLRIDISLAEMGLKDPSKLPEWCREYQDLVSKVGWSMVLEANRALRDWEPRRKELLSLLRHRLSSGDDRSWKRVTGTLLHHVRKQFPVGQGGFHAGVVGASVTGFPYHPTFPGGALSLFYVYDCGSIPRRFVDREIDRLLDAARGRTLDLLYLSHFDCDHICGTPRLLDSKIGLKVDTIVMPFVDDAERLVAYGRSAQRRYAPATRTFFDDMIVDPTEALERFGPRQIIYVFGDGEAPPELADVGPSDPPRGGEMWKIEGSQGSAPEAWRSPGNRGVVVRNATIAVSSGGVRGGWRLIPFVQRADRARVEAFARAAEVLLGWERGSFEPMVREKAVRRELVTKNRVVLGRAYNYAFGDKNITSLCLYSGPDDPEGAGVVQLWPKLSPADRAKVAWLATGDANLADPDVISDFERHYRGVLDYVSTFMLPHHGSIHNSDPTNLISDADIWVAAAEPRNPEWEHPADELVQAVLRRGAIFEHVRSALSTSLIERMLIYWPHTET